VQREDFTNRIVNLRFKCNAAREKIAELRQSQDTGWNKLREGADQMWVGIKQLVKDTREAFQQGQKEAGKFPRHRLIGRCNYFNRL